MLESSLKKVNRAIRIPIPVRMLYLDENREYTGEYEIFESISKASRVTRAVGTSISKIINQNSNYYTTKHKNNGKRVTFVTADATQEEIREHINKVKDRKRGSKPVSIKMIYLDEDNEDTGEYEIFEGANKTSEVTG